VAVLFDTSVLVRLANTADRQHAVAQQALTKLEQAGEIVCVAPQNLIEFRNVTTRPLAQNGLGLSLPTAEQQAAKFERDFVLLEEDKIVYGAWKQVVQAIGVIGKQVHDARLVAVCHVCGISHILTFNVRDFVRFAALPPGLTVVDPTTV
jgi:predicted nucleic acid-binding protein